MKVTQKQAGLALMAVAVVLMGSVAIAEDHKDNRMDQPGMMGPGFMGMGGGMGGPMMMPRFSFDALDADKDGKISQAEITAWRAGQTAGVDANGDGKLSVDELAAMRLKEMQAVAQDMAQKMVDRLDTDGDKMLSAAELLAPPVPVNLFDRVDANKDGFIDQAEADAARKAMMEHMRGGHGFRHDRTQDTPEGDGGN